MVCVINFFREDPCRQCCPCSGAYDPAGRWLMIGGRSLEVGRNRYTGVDSKFCIHLFLIQVFIILKHEIQNAEQLNI